jgi:hypothetical protein
MSAVAIGPAAARVAPAVAPRAASEAIIVAPNAKPTAPAIGARPAGAAARASASARPVAEPIKAAPARTLTQAGRVLDESGQPLVGATVMLRGTTKGTSTDDTGGYSLQVPAGDNTLVVGYGGYEDEIATTHNAQPLTVTLLPKAGATMTSVTVPNPKTKGRRVRR